MLHEQIFDDILSLFDYLRESSKGQCRGLVHPEPRFEVMQMGQSEDGKNKLEAKGCKFVDTLPFAYTKEELDYLQEEHRRLYPNIE